MSKTVQLLGKETERKVRELFRQCRSSKLYIRDSHREQREGISFINKKWDRQAVRAFCQIVKINGQQNTIATTIRQSFLWDFLFLLSTGQGTLWEGVGGKRCCIIAEAVVANLCRGDLWFPPLAVLVCHLATDNCTAWCLMPMCVCVFVSELFACVT